MDFNEFLRNIRPNGVANTPVNAIKRAIAFEKATIETLEAFMHINQKGLSNKIKAGIEFWDKSYNLNQQTLNVGMTINEIGSTDIEVNSGVRSDTYNGVDLETGVRLSTKALLQGNRILHVPIKMIILPSPTEIMKDRYYSIIDKYGGDRGVQREAKEMEKEFYHFR